MKKIIVLSDTHGYTTEISKIAHLFSECDYVIHLGDGVTDMKPYSQLGSKLICVCGNCDSVFARVSDERIVEVEGVKLFLTHGHRYAVKTTLINLGYEAQAKGCDVAFFGHTHSSVITEFGGVKLINPGSMSVSYGGLPSYCYLIVHGNKILPRIVEVV